MPPDCAQGKTRDEALANIREAIDLALQTRDQEGWTLPTEYEVVHLAVAV